MVAQDTTSANDNNASAQAKHAMQAAQAKQTAAQAKQTEDEQRCTLQVRPEFFEYCQTLLSRDKQGRSLLPATLTVEQARRIQETYWHAPKLTFYDPQWWEQQKAEQTVTLTGEVAAHCWLLFAAVDSSRSKTYEDVRELACQLLPQIPTVVADSDADAQFAQECNDGHQDFIEAACFVVEFEDSLYAFRAAEALGCAPFLSPMRSIWWVESMPGKHVLRGSTTVEGKALDECEDFTLMHRRWARAIIDDAMLYPNYTWPISKRLPAIAELFTPEEFQERCFRFLPTITTRSDRDRFLACWSTCGLDADLILRNEALFLDILGDGCRAQAAAILAQGLLGVAASGRESANLYEAVIAATHVRTAKHLKVVLSTLASRPAPDAEQAELIIAHLVQLDERNKLANELANLRQHWGVEDAARAGDSVVQQPHPLLPWVQPAPMPPLVLHPQELDIDAVTLRRHARALFQADNDTQSAAWWDLEQRVDPFRLGAAMMHLGDEGARIVLEEFQVVHDANPVTSRLPFNTSDPVIAQAWDTLVELAVTFTHPGFGSARDDLRNVLTHPGWEPLCLVEDGNYSIEVEWLLQRLRTRTTPIAIWDLSNALQDLVVWRADAPNLTVQQRAAFEAIDNEFVLPHRKRILETLDELSEAKAELLLCEPALRTGEHSLDTELCRQFLDGGYEQRLDLKLRGGSRGQLFIGRIDGGCHYIPGSMAGLCPPWRDLFWGLGRSTPWSPWELSWILSQAMNTYGERATAVFVRGWQRGLVDAANFEPMLLQHKEYSSIDIINRANAIAEMLVQLSHDPNVHMAAFAWPAIHKLVAYYVQALDSLTGLAPVLQAMVDLAPYIPQPQRSAVDTTALEALAVRKGKSLSKQLAVQALELIRAEV